MHRPVIRLQGRIQSLSFRGQQTCLPLYDWSEFDINTAKSACKVRLPDGAEVALSKWTGPKRTRTYPLAKVYDTYSHSGKIISIIPIIKDEGRGERQSDTNLDRVNFITLSWMNLMNIYVVLAWYCDARKKDDYRITGQRMDNAYIRRKIEQIVQYKMDAHHWNRDHFVREFIPIYESALRSYESISKRLRVALHSKDGHIRFIDSVRDSTCPQHLDLQKYAEYSLSASLRAAQRETETQHVLERTQGQSAKGLFEIRNYLGGVYYLTADELIFERRDFVIIQESKNSTRHELPSLNDIKDGLFKLLLYSQLQEVRQGNMLLGFKTRLRLTGAFSGALRLPMDPLELQHISARWSKASISKLQWLNVELERLGIECVLEGNL
ncbi:MAG: hypothetical protein N2554_06890 [Fimbriimonadales bacterium]|nr:hypothetical protein [Fimbriimonadales bacterium]